MPRSINRLRIGYQSVAHNRLSAGLRTSRPRRVLTLSGASLLIVAASDEILVESIASLRFQVLSDVGKPYWQRAIPIQRAIAIPTAIAMPPPTNTILAAADSQHAPALDLLVGRGEGSQARWEQGLDWGGRQRPRRSRDTVHRQGLAGCRSRPRFLRTAPGAIQ